MTPDPNEKVRRPMDVPTDETEVELEASSSDERAREVTAVATPRPSRTNITGSMPAYRGPRDRGRRG